MGSSKAIAEPRRESGQPEIIIVCMLQAVTQHESARHQWLPARNALHPGELVKSDMVITERLDLLGFFLRDLVPGVAMDMLA